MHRTSVVSLQAEPPHVLQERENTLTTYMTRDVVDSFVAKVNRYYRRQGKRKDPRSISTLKWGIKPKIKNMLYSHNLWGGSYYGKVLARADISEKLFIQGRLSNNKPKPKVEAPRNKEESCLLSLVNGASGVTTTKVGSDHLTATHGSQLGAYQYQLQKDRQLKSMHSKNRSTYNRFVDMVNSNLTPPKTLEDKIERQKLMKKCESYKHLRDMPKHSDGKIRPYIKTKKVQQAENRQECRQAMRGSMDILQTCKQQHCENNKMRSSLCAFSGFCKTIDRHLVRRKNELNPAETFA